MLTSGVVKLHCDALTLLVFRDRDLLGSGPKCLSRGRELGLVRVDGDEPVTLSHREWRYLQLAQAGTAGRLRGAAKAKGRSSAGQQAGHDLLESWESNPNGGCGTRYSL